MSVDNPVLRTAPPVDVAARAINSAIAGAHRPPIFGRIRLLSWLRQRRGILTLAAALIILVVVPVLVVIVGSFRPMGLPMTAGWTVRHYVDIWSSPYTYTLLLNTLIFAGGSTVVALSISGLLAWLLERTDVPLGGFFKSLLVVPMLMPPLLLGMGWILLVNTRIGIFPALIRDLGFNFSLEIYSIGGMIFVQGLAAVPTSFLILSPAMRNMNPSFEEAAYTSGASFWQALRRIMLPSLAPAMTSVATLVFILSMMSFDIPAIMGMPAHINVLSTEVYNLLNNGSGLPKYGKSAAINASLFLPLLLALIFYHHQTKNSDRFTTVKGKAFRPQIIRLERWRYCAFAIVALYIVVSVILPFLALIWMSLVPYFSGINSEMFSRLSLAAYEEVLKRPAVQHAALRTLIVSTLVAAGVTVCAMIIAWVVVRSRLRLAKALDFMAMLPLATPSLMMGVAIMFVAFSFSSLGLYGTIWIIVIAHVVVFLPVGVRMMQTAVIQIDKEIEEAAEVSGAGRFRIARSIISPLIQPAIYGVAIWVLVHSFREFPIATILKTADNELLAPLLFTYWESGSSAVAAAIAVILIAFLIVVTAIVNAIIYATRIPNS